jgi:two-component system nitrogen regulation sensor histidine kinase NtrY
LILTTSAKIRILLALLSVSLIITAIIAGKIYSPRKNLEHAASNLENNLHKKEKYVNSIINSKQAFNKLKNITKNEAFAFKVINEATTENRIWVVTYKNRQLNYWSGIKLIPPDGGSGIKEGTSFLKTGNGYYEVIKKTDGNFTAVFCILVRDAFRYQNTYLKNRFEPTLSNDPSIELAQFSDQNICGVHSLSGAYLFSVKNASNTLSPKFLYFETALWVFGFLVLCILVQQLCGVLARKGHVILSVICLSAFIVITRAINLFLHWPWWITKFGIFNASHFTSGPWLPSFGDFCINLLFACWLAAYVYNYRRRLFRPIQNKVAAYVICLICTLVLLAISLVLVNMFYSLVIKSNINFDVNNVLTLTGYSFVGVIMLGFSFMAFYLVNETILYVSTKLNIPLHHKLAIFISAIIVATFISAYQGQFTLFYFFWAAIVLIRGYAIYHKNGDVETIPFVIIILICSLISAVKLNYFESVKERETRKELVQRLESANDINADRLFTTIEHQIIDETFLISYFQSASKNTAYLKNRFQKLYFDGYLSKYDFNLYVFDKYGNALSKDKGYSLNDYKDMVLYSSFKVSDYFYRENDSFGFQSYFAIIPVLHDDAQLGTVIISLKSKPALKSVSFPALLDDGLVKQQNGDYADYSYAFYIDNKLLSQSGNFIYSLQNTDFKGRQEKYVFRTTQPTDQPMLHSLISYNHLIYQPSSRKLIIVTKEENVLMHSITSLTFFFVMLLIFSTVVILIRWLWMRVKLLNINDSYIRWRFRISLDKVLYKTRIQISIIFAVVVTLFIVGLITYLSIRSQYILQQDNMIRDKLTRIASAFENGLSIDVNNITEESQVKFNEFANTYSTDLNLYNKRGNLLISTQPKIYDFGLLAPQMHAKAYIYLKRLQKSELVNQERIGQLEYKAAYVPVRNTKNITIAYLQLPYFSNSADYDERIGTLLNAMINIYAIVFIAIGILAFIIARQITSPLNFIQHSLSKTIYGKKNEPIKWERNDEIGALVKEYNKMIAALEHSAQKLAQSERESAWREMAKQVAHEIKNPLTPLKLGLQLLEKSWKDKDAKFDQKFERFSKSFVEQIESLSSIASEFSAFAKMPDTRMERINIFELLNQAVIIFKQMENTTIAYHVPEQPVFIFADRDQLLRCFNNLLKNAIESVPQTRDRLIQIDHNTSNNHILLIIKDNGNGIPENMRVKIFEPNFTTKSSGTGLGLAFVKNSIENAGGAVWFETTTGKGTTFYLNLPTVP